MANAFDEFDNLMSGILPLLLERGADPMRSSALPYIMKRTDQAKWDTVVE